MANARSTLYGEKTRFPEPPRRPSNASASWLVERTAAPAPPLDDGGGVGGGFATRGLPPHAASTRLRARAATAGRTCLVRGRSPQHLGPLRCQREVAFERRSVAE